MKRAILVGAGGMGQTWADVLNHHDQVQIAAWVDTDFSRASDAIQAKNLIDTKPYGSLKEAIKAESADFVVDVTIPEAHCSVTVEALRSGLPVLGEKPMAASMEQAKQMVAASEESGKLYMVSQSRRYDRMLIAYREALRENGTLGILNVDFYLGPHFGGFRDEMESPLILDMAIHTFDQARFLSGSKPLAAYCYESNPHWSWMKGAGCATAIFEMSDGLVFNYRGSWVAEGCLTSWEGEWRGVGERGTALWDGHNAIRSEEVLAGDGEFFRPVRSRNLEAPPEILEGIRGSLGEFLEALESGSTPQGECHDNILSLAMVFACMKSSREKRRVEISELI
ncbi:MAG: Gfo/Idh/MocA family oxidoreductase [Fimbriimonadaceae bacterium]|nr:Gfo/Idh/MocA family oxidoreductase [Fimbriimonadaceae bacterium]